MNPVIIGRAHTPYHEQLGTPIAPVFAEGEPATLEIFKAYRTGLSDVAGFQRIWVISWLDRSKGYELLTVPYRDIVKRGVFATRAPRRPNPVGLSCVEIDGLDIESGVISVRGIDLLDGTPILDIKPYIPKADAFPESRAGWFDESRDIRHADRRFENGREL